MKQIFILAIILSLVSCLKDPADDPNKNLLECENDPFHFSVDVAGISFESDSCWMIFYEDPSSIGLNSDFPAVIKWTVPDYPMWNSANSLSFAYNSSAVQKDEKYNASELIGVVEFDGTTGEMFQTLGEEQLVITISEYSTSEGYVCGTFEGKAKFTDYEIVDVVGSFKGIISPQ